MNKTTKKTWADNKLTGDHYVKSIQSRATPINTPQHGKSSDHQEENNKLHHQNSPQFIPIFNILII
jgi:hypothetical protein